MGYAVRLFLVLFLVCLTAAPGAGHELRIPVLVDTDMGLDDVRALALILSDPHLEVKAVVTSEGAASSEAGLGNLRRVMQFLKREDIPLGQGGSSDKAPPPWRSRSDSLGGARLPAAAAAPVTASGAVIVQVLQAAPDRLTYICLGPLTNLAAVLTRRPELGPRLKVLLYAGAPPEVPDPSWNTARDLEAARQVFASGVQIIACHLKPHPLHLDAGLLKQIRTINTPAARLIGLLYQSPQNQKLLGTEHSQAWDDTIPLYINDPSLGRLELKADTPPVKVLVKWDGVRSRAAYLELLQGGGQALAPRATVVLRRYPTEPWEFRADVQPYVQRIIARHGLEEFKAALLTNELHRHLGTFSILGAKMGIRAREVLGADLDALTVESRAGLKPPLSCFNDGLQAATGASLGRGAIVVRAGESLPAATFRYGSKRLTLCLKDDIFRRLRGEQKALALRFGGMGPEYFREIRAASLKHWLELDRREIFVETLEGGN
ncbi:MAG: nucleoside hydrolase [Thermodesulfobacteriota bacterium]